jgi:hypothetical protein
MSESKPVIVKVALTEANFDKAHLSAASGDETFTDTVNRAIAFYHAVMAASPGTVMNWEFVDGTIGKVRRLQ